MISIKFIWFFAIIFTNLALINGQFGMHRPNGFFKNAAESQAEHHSQNTNFQNNKSGSFAFIAGTGIRNSNTNFNQQHSDSSASNFQENQGSFGNHHHHHHMFRTAESSAEENDEENMSRFRYASPYDTPTYIPKKPAYHAPAYKAPAYAAPVQCPQNLLVGCAPKVQYVPCAPPPSYGYQSNY